MYVCMYVCIPLGIQTYIDTHVWNIYIYMQMSISVYIYIHKQIPKGGQGSIAFCTESSALLPSGLQESAWLQVFESLALPGSRHKPWLKP